jgi:hypothetical protein
MASLVESSATLSCGYLNNYNRTGLNMLREREAACSADGIHLQNFELEI